MTSIVSMRICYWCGNEVLASDGAKEHIVPKALLKDVASDVDISEFIIPAENVHKICNQTLGNKYEHDFCQILFHYSLGDQKAHKHNESKVRNLKRNLIYAKNQFNRMRRTEAVTVISLTSSEKKAFEECIKKILKGIYFKVFDQYLDLGEEFFLKINLNTFNIEHDSVAREQVKEIASLFGQKGFKGNEVFKYRLNKVENRPSSVWEFLFYDRFPVYMFLIHKSDKEGFNWIH